MEKTEGKTRKWATVAIQHFISASALFIVTKKKI